MSPWGHHTVGLVMGATGAWILNRDASGDLLAMTDSLGFLAGALFGGRAPDKLEIASWSTWTGKRHSLIPHRTFTHWPPLWIAILGYSIYYLQQATDATESGIGWGGIAFALSGIVHLVLDIMTPTGIPLLDPFGRRTAFPVYISGSLAEIPLIGAVVGICVLVGQMVREGLI